MRAYGYERFGPLHEVVRLREVPPPQLVASEVRVRVKVAAINPLDWKLVEGQFNLFAKSKPPCGIGTEFGGVIDAHGRGVAAPPIGTRVVGFINPFARHPGALQDFVTVPARAVVPVPDGIDLAAASTLPCAGVSALQMCRLARVERGQRVLIHGAAGGVGSFAVQIVRALGAVPFATGSTESQAMIAQLAPRAQIDYEHQPATTWGGPFAVVLDCASSLAPAAIETLLAEGGHYVATLPKLPAVVFDPLLNPFRRLKRRTLRLHANAADIATLLRWLADGRVRPLITQRFAFADTVAALERSKSGRARGKLVIDLA